MWNGLSLATWARLPSLKERKSKKMTLNQKNKEMKIEQSFLIELDEEHDDETRN